MKNFNHNHLFPAGELSALLRKAPTITGAYNTSYMAHFVRQNSAFSGTSYSPKTLYEISNPAFRNIFFYFFKF